MRSPLFFRPNGHVVRTRGMHRDASFAFLAIAALLGLLAWGHQVDQAAEAEDAYARGVADGRAQLAATVADAYTQGRRDVLGEGPASADACDRPAAALLVGGGVR